MAVGTAIGIGHASMVAGTADPAGIGCTDGTRAALGVRGARLLAMTIWIRSAHQACLAVGLDEAGPAHCARWVAKLAPRDAAHTAPIGAAVRAARAGMVAGAAHTAAIRGTDPA